MIMYQIETNLDLMKPNLVVQTQQLGSILLVYVLIATAQSNRVQTRIFLFDRFEP